MVNEAGPRPPKIERGVECGQAKARVQEVADGVTDDSPRPRVEHDRQKNEAGGEPDVSEICHPEFVRPRRRDRRFQVRIDGLFVIAVRRGEPCAYAAGRERVLPHNTRDSLVIDHQAASPELMRDPSIAVGGELSQDVFDPHPQVPIGFLTASPMLRVRSFVERASRHVHEATPPSDRDTPGPEMIDGRSLFSDGCIRALFFMTSSSIVS